MGALQEELLQREDLQTDQEKLVRKDKENNQRIHSKQELHLNGVYFDNVGLIRKKEVTFKSNSIRVNIYFLISANICF